MVDARDCMLKRHELLVLECRAAFDMRRSRRWQRTLDHLCQVRQLASTLLAPLRFRWSEPLTPAPQQPATYVALIAAARRAGVGERAHLAITARNKLHEVVLLAEALMQELEDPDKPGRAVPQLASYKLLDVLADV